MKIIIAVAVLIAVALAAPQQPDKDAVILKSSSDNIGIDGYNFDFETSNGIQRNEQGVVSNVGSDKESLSVRGSIKWVDRDGTPYSLDFVADENGFQPTGAHLPH